VGAGAYIFRERQPWSSLSAGRWMMLILLQFENQIYILDPEAGLQGKDMPERPGPGR
jgi:hypothetical protein